MGKYAFYAVARGRNIGLYSNWTECEMQVGGFKGAKFKGFNSQDDAKRFIEANKTVLEQSKQILENTVRQNGIYNEATSNDINKDVTGKRKLEINGAEESTKSESVLSNKRIKANPISKERRKAHQFDTEDILSSTKNPKIQNTTKCDINISRENGFTIDDEGFFEVYTDGACINNGKKGAKAGIGVFWSNKYNTLANALNVSEPVTGNRATNNVAEIQAVTRSIHQAIEQHISKLRVISDSRFTIQCVEDWMPKWKKNGWKTAIGDVINRVDLEKLDECLQKANQCGTMVTFKHVRGHMGNYGNEAADRLALSGAHQFLDNKKLANCS